jgi:hypothetical protein
LVEVGALIGLVAVVAISAVSVAGNKVREIFGGSANALAFGMNGTLTDGVNLAGGVSGTNSAPSWVTASGQVGTVRPVASSGSVIATLSATDLDGNALSYSASGSPVWASLSSSGVLSIAAGQTSPQVSSDQSFSFSATVSDGIASPVVRSFSLLVLNSPPTISSSSSLSIPVGGTPVALSASDVNGDAISWSMTGSFPGLSLKSDGTWTGVASTVGTYSPVVSASDGKGGVSSQTLSAVVSYNGVSACPGAATSSGVGTGSGWCRFTALGNTGSFSVAGTPSVTVSAWGGGGGGSYNSAAGAWGGAAAAAKVTIAASNA